MIKVSSCFNLFLSNAFQMKIFIFNKNAFTPIVGFVSVLIIMVALYTLRCVFRRKNNLIQLIKY